MKKNDFVQTKGLDVKELIVKVKALREEIANLTLDKNMKKMKDLKTIFKKRKEIAQMLTLIRQKELLLKLESRVKNQESSKQSPLQGRDLRSKDLKDVSKARKEKSSH
ncbi:50S ribosomal protein L29 [Candidatus Daviesbacteria bacterium]|nr:50S ribosomal protein L29 [Candidatus Daviesbacteria bacterium]